jgi:hypothetical protein
MSCEREKGAAERRQAGGGEERTPARSLWMSEVSSVDLLERVQTGEGGVQVDCAYASSCWQTVWRARTVDSFALCLPFDPPTIPFSLLLSLSTFSMSISRSSTPKVVESADPAHVAQSLDGSSDSDDQLVEKRFGMKVRPSTPLSQTRGKETLADSLSFPRDAERVCARVRKVSVLFAIVGGSLSKPKLAPLESHVLTRRLSSVSRPSRSPSRAYSCQAD